MILVVDSEFEALIPPLGAEEIEYLRKNILAAGRITDPIKVGRFPTGDEFVLDGHNRYRLYRELAREDAKFPDPPVAYVELADREAAKAWMRDNQRGRRNLSPDQKIALDTLAGVAIPGQQIKKSQAAILSKDAPALLQDVISGSKTLQQAYNDHTRATKPASAQSPATKLSPPKGTVHFIIGDTQAREGVPTEHLTWIGRYLVDHVAKKHDDKDVKVIHLGDHWDMPSLSSYDRGKKSSENRRYLVDIDAGNKSFKLLTEPLEKYNAGRRKQWKPQFHFLLGNHEDRIRRACEDAAFLDGTLSLEDLNAKECGWNVHPFRVPVLLDGISYAHYFYNPHTGNPYPGLLSTRLAKIGHSFTQGHTQGFDYAERHIDGVSQHGLVLGSSYLHDEDYKGPQGNGHWRGIVVCHRVKNGSYDLMKVGLGYLCERYTGKSLSEWMADWESEQALRSAA